MFPHKHLVSAVGNGATGRFNWDRGGCQTVVKMAHSPMMVSRNLSYGVIVSATKLDIVPCCTGEPPIRSGRGFVKHSGQFSAAKRPETASNHCCPDLDGPTTFENFIQVQAGIGLFGNFFLILA